MLAGNLVDVCGKAQGAVLMAAEGDVGGGGFEFERIELWTAGEGYEPCGGRCGTHGRDIMVEGGKLPESLRIGRGSSLSDRGSDEVDRLGERDERDEARGSGEENATL